MRALRIENNFDLIKLAARVRKIAWTEKDIFLVRLTTTFKNRQPLSESELNEAYEAIKLQMQNAGVNVRKLVFVPEYVDIKLLKNACKGRR